MTTDRLAFRRIAVRRAPGFEDRGFELTDLSPGINLVHGPQAVGKSTTGRVIAWLLWPELQKWREHSVTAELTIGGERWIADAAHAQPRLQRSGRDAGRLPTPGRELADRYSLALHELLQVQTEEADLARLIDRELAGGFDLDAALTDVGARERPGRPRIKIDNLTKAEERVVEAESEQAALAEEERSLEYLREQEAEARRARQELAKVRVLSKWRQCCGEVEREEQVLEKGFPEAMERLVGDEAERLADLDQRIGETERRIEDLRRKIERAKVRLEEADLPERGVPRETLTTLSESHQRLVKLESAMAERKSALEGARSHRDGARARLGASAENEMLRQLKPDDWEPFLKLARQGERLRGRRAQVEDVESWIGRVASPARSDSLVAGIGRLRRWLASPAAPGRLGAPGLVAALLLTGLALVLAVAAPAPFLPKILLWIGAALGAGLAWWIVVGVLQGASERRAAEREYQGLDLDPPAQWSPKAVEARLRSLESQLVEKAVEEEKTARWATLEGQRQELEREEAELVAEREELIRRLGIAPELTTDKDEAPLAAFVRDLCAFRAADEAAREQESVLAARQKERDEVLASAGKRLAAFGYPEPETGPGAVEALAGRLEELRGREKQSADAREVLDETAGPHGALPREEASAERLRRERRELFERLEPTPGEREEPDRQSGGRAELTRLLSRLPDYREQAKRVENARYDLKRARADLPDESADEGAEEREGSRLRDLPEEDLAARQADLEGRTERLEALVTRIGVIEDRVARAKESHNLEEALAARDDALAALRGERGRDADALVTHELGTWLREQMRGRRRPSVMKRAAELFARITAGRFQLLDPEGDPPRLRAKDTASRRGRSLGELSGGIRLQLLLAVRMAFIEDREGSVRLPLVMDETLANSDDRTARSIIDAVLELARDGRQVFYLTAQADEVAKWKAALQEMNGDAPEWREIDLAAVRHLQEVEAFPRSTWHPQVEPVPAPEGRSRDEYAEALKIPGLDAHQDVGHVHLWYLVEETETLYSLIQSGMTRWGQIKTLGEAAGSLLGGGEEGERRHRGIQARARCLEALFQAWREGRGRPVSKQELQESGAVSDRFIEEVSDLSDRLGGDASALIQALRDREVTSFRTDKIEALETHLEEQGHLDPRPRLTRESLRARALQSLRDDLEQGHITPVVVEALLGQLPSD